MMKFRDLKAEEIEVRVSRCNNWGVDLLLYKDNRVDMRILDETAGAENWQTKFYECKGTLFCSLGIYTDENGWVWKDNAGAPSNMEAQKGEASDAFKRAAFTWGIGRCLYTSPEIFIKSNACNIKQGKNGKLQCYDKFRVEKIRIEEGEITGLSIWNETTGHRCFVWTKDDKNEQ
jgi:hypothetical protein